MHYVYPCKVMRVYKRDKALETKKDGSALRVDKGWYVHLNLDSGGISFYVGDERPALESGDTVRILLEVNE